MKILISLRSILYKIFICFGMILFCCSKQSTCQIFRFKHILSQAEINNSGFTLNLTSGSIPIHPLVQLSQGNNFTLIPNIVDTINTNNNIVTLSSANRFVVTTDLTTQTFISASIGAYIVTPGVRDSVYPNVSISILPKTTIYLFSDNNTKIDIRSISSIPDTTFSDMPGVVESTRTTTVINRDTTISEIITKTMKISRLPAYLCALNVTVCQLAAPTEGIITVSGNKILFDVYSLTRLVTVPSGVVNAIGNTTSIPLEIKDGRTVVTQPTKILKVPYKHFTVGINTLPFRYRSRKILQDTVYAKGTAATSFSLAVSLGYTWGFSRITTRARNDFSFTIGPFAGPSSVQLTAQTVTDPIGFASSALSNKNPATSAVFSYGVNTIFARNGFGLILALGFDKLFGQYSKEWIYNNTPWFGIGVAANFLN